MLAVLTRSRVTVVAGDEGLSGYLDIANDHVPAGNLQACNANASSVWPSWRTVVGLSCRETEAPVFRAAGLSVQGAWARLESLAAGWAGSTAGCADHCGSDHGTAHEGRPATGPHARRPIPVTSMHLGLRRMRLDHEVADK
jgi:hypothetical protein